jgi:hypothetical protein
MDLNNKLNGKICLVTGSNAAGGTIKRGETNDGVRLDGIRAEEEGIFGWK